MGRERCQTCGKFADSLWAGECHPCWEHTADRMFWEQVPVMDAALATHHKGEQDPRPQVKK